MSGVESAVMALSVTTNPVHVGQLELRGPVQPVQVPCTFASALLLVTVDGVPAGQVTVPLVDGYASVSTILATVHDELGSDVAAAPPLRSVGRALTVVVATRSRSVSLGRCLRSLLRSEHPWLSVLVVDNDPDDADTAAAVAVLDDSDADRPLDVDIQAATALLPALAVHVRGSALF